MPNVRGKSRGRAKEGKGSGRGRTMYGFTHDATLTTHTKERADQDPRWVRKIPTKTISLN
jgi:hypothetical protein